MKVVRCAPGRSPRISSLTDQRLTVGDQRRDRLSARCVRLPLIGEKGEVTG